MGMLKDMIHREDLSVGVAIGSHSGHAPKGVLSTTTMLLEARRDRKGGNFEQSYLKYSRLSSSRGLSAVFRKVAKKQFVEMFKKAMEKEGDVQQQEAARLLSGEDELPEKRRGVVDGLVLGSLDKEVSVDQKREAVELLMTSADFYVRAEKARKAALMLESALYVVSSIEELKDLNERIMREIAILFLFQAEGIIPK